MLLRLVLIGLLTVTAVLGRADGLMRGWVDPVDYNHRDFGGGRYILPNESQFYLFDEAISDRTGVLISLGTFRGLEMASRGKFTQLIMGDIDKGVVNFNRFQIEVLAKSPTRKDFILNFLECPDLFETFGVAAWQRRRYLEKVFEFCESTRGEGRTAFLADEARYLRLHKMAKAGKIYSVFMDLAGTEPLEIASRLKAEGLMVGTLDISNAPDYFLSPSKDAEAPENLNQFKKNLRALPFASDAHVNLTTSYKLGERRGADTFHYFTFGTEDFKRLINSIGPRHSYYEAMLTAPIPSQTLCNQKLTGRD